MTDSMGPVTMGEASHRSVAVTLGVLGRKHSDEVFGGKLTKVGGIVSTTVTLNEILAELPQTSMAAIMV